MDKTETVYEHQRITLDTNYINIADAWQKDTRVSENERKVRLSFFRVGNKELIFQQFVGVLKLGDLTIEVLPKIDKLSKSTTVWQRVLLQMLQNALNLEVKATNNAAINLEQTTVLQFYFNWFLQEVNLLMHQGLIKKYVAKTENRTALKGRLQLQKHLMYNMVHAERFYVTYNDYNQNHVYNALIRQCLQAVTLLAKDSSVGSEAASILNWFPECNKVAIHEKTFDRLVYHRKTERYKTAIKIAKIILLNFHPDLRGGHHDVLAIMFDMNKLWEQYVLSQLQQASTDYTFQGQARKDFWKKNDTGRSKIVKPDIVAKVGEDTKFIIDTKWKIIDDDLNKTVSDADLKQMFVYNQLWNCKQSILLYPGVGYEKPETGIFVDEEKFGRCSTLKISILDDYDKLKTNIGEEIENEIKKLLPKQPLVENSVQQSSPLILAK